MEITGRDRDSVINLVLYMNRDFAQRQNRGAVATGSVVGGTPGLFPAQTLYTRLFEYDQLDH